MTSVNSKSFVGVCMELTPSHIMNIRPPEPGLLPPPCGRHKWMVPKRAP